MYFDSILLESTCHSVCVQCSLKVLLKEPPFTYIHTHPHTSVHILTVKFNAAVSGTHHDNSLLVRMDCTHTTVCQGVAVCVCVCGHWRIFVALPSSQPLQQLNSSPFSPIKPLSAVHIFHLVPLLRLACHCSSSVIFIAWRPNMWTTHYPSSHHSAGGSCSAKHSLPYFFPTPSKLFIQISSVVFFFLHTIVVLCPFGI